MDYSDFLQTKRHRGSLHGFKPMWMPDFLFDFQAMLTDWAIHKGRAAIFADCGLGKTPMQLVWAENVVRETNRPVLILTPLAVSHQTLKEGEKFGIKCTRTREGVVGKAGIYVTNYERLHYFDPAQFSGVVCDESSILKSFDGATRNAITDFMRKMPYRLLCTATASPNDYIELGTSSEALGDMGYMDMLSMFFKADDSTLFPHKGRFRFSQGKWRFRQHGAVPFWRWVCSWARACRKPSDLGFEDGDFVLPPMKVRETVIACSRPKPGTLFAMPARTLQEQRDERRQTIDDRCELVAERLNGNNSAVAWCHLNAEGDLLERLIPDATQVSGADSDELKEEKFLAFVSGEIRVLVTKPRIGGFGLNWQHCSHMSFFPSHSFEQYYQGTRRCWRFGQKRPVVVEIVTTEGEKGVRANLERKAKQAEGMFESLIENMNHELKLSVPSSGTNKVEAPEWL